MGIVEKYRLKREILSIHSEYGRRTVIMIPSGAVVKVTHGPLDGLRLVDVLWEDKMVMLFTDDLRERGTLIKSSTTATGR